MDCGWEAHLGGLGGQIGPGLCPRACAEGPRAPCPAVEPWARPRAPGLYGPLVPGPHWPRAWAREMRMSHIQDCIRGTKLKMRAGYLSLNGIGWKVSKDNLENEHGHKVTWWRSQRNARTRPGPQGLQGLPGFPRGPIPRPLHTGQLNPWPWALVPAWALAQWSRARGPVQWSRAQGPGPVDRVPGP